MKGKDWFKTWFNSPYYHLLYKDRNYLEAEKFISALTQHIHLPVGARCLDLACGKGRHSIFLNQKGFRVSGVDLSPESIKEAKLFENETLDFTIHDMRKVFMENEFDAIFNLFTSFGYFDDYQDNVDVLKSIHTMLVPKGKFVLDFMNSYYVIRNLVPKEVKQVGGIKFDIERSYDGRHIFKDIYFQDKGESFHFQERVQAIKLDDFELLFDKAGFELEDVFGDFKLNPYEKNTSDRLILIAHKKL